MAAKVIRGQGVSLLELTGEKGDETRVKKELDIRSVLLNFCDQAAVIIIYFEGTNPSQHFFPNIHDSMNNNQNSKTLQQSRFLCSHISALWFLSHHRQNTDKTFTDRTTQTENRLTCGCKGNDWVQTAWKPITLL